ncbi:hypothetical protein [Kordia sp.]|uniref:hypothetical protein n=1 Tax=Kordia sp. TaxID=1965332 RepID=UPI003D265BDD
MITDETYKWVKKLINAKITEISDDNYDKLAKDYFQKEKTDWYENNERMQLSLIIKESDFWKLIRKFSMPRGEKKRLFDFSNFIFPAFEPQHLNELSIKGKSYDNFWKKEDNKVFTYSVNFNEAIFLKKSIFTDTVFQANIEFVNAKFNDGLIIGNCEFNKNIIFRKSELESLEIYESTFQKEMTFKDSECYGKLSVGTTNFKGFPSFYYSKFHQKAIFGKSEFSGHACRFNDSIFLEDVEFFECNFGNNTEFLAVTFSKKADFIRPEFHDKVSFNQSQFKGVTIFDLPIFKGKADFSYCYFEDVNFKEVNTFWSRRKLNYTKPPELYFKDVFFNSKAFIKNTDLSALELDNCDVSNITFSRCVWNDDKNRLKLVNELPHKNIETENRLKLANHHPSKKAAVENLINKLRDSENHYRQLKKNFDTTKSWELSGKAYVSEMEMRKQRLWLEGKLYQWFIYKFYDVFGGYTQDFKKPIVSLVGLILVFSGLYFFIDYDISRAIQRGVKGALPYMQITTGTAFEGYWLILRNLELVLGGTFLAFFILALRKRFKQ